MNLSVARIFVPDVGAAKTFYQSLLGLRLKSDGVHDGFCVFDAGDIDLVIESVPEDAPEEDRVRARPSCSVRRASWRT